MRSPTEQEIADGIGVSLAEYQKMLNDARGMQLVYLEDLSGPDADESFLARYEADASEDMLTILRSSPFREALESAIGQLPEREQMIMGMYYEQDMNLKEIGAVLGVTESRVSQLHSQAVARLRTHLKNWR